LSAGCLRYNARRDATEEAIVCDLRRAGCSVYRLSGRDLPDLLVGLRGETYLLEVKTNAGKVRPNQEAWATGWKGRPSAVVRSSLEALTAVGLRR